MKKNSILIFLLAFCSHVVYCQTTPSDSDVIKAIREQYKGEIIDIKLSKTGGTRRLNHRTLVWEYARTAYVTFKEGSYTKIRNVDAIFHDDGRFRKLLFGDARYHGIPNPKKEEVEKLIANNIPMFLGYLYAKIPGGSTLKSLEFNAEKGFKWHNTKSVTLHLLAVSDNITSYTEVKESKFNIELRLYKQSEKGAYQNFISTVREIESGTSSKYSADEIRSMKNGKRPSNLPTIDNFPE